MVTNEENWGQASPIYTLIMVVAAVVGTWTTHMGTANMSLGNNIGSSSTLTLPR